MSKLESMLRSLVLRRVEDVRDYLHQKPVRNERSLPPKQVPQPLRNSMDNLVVVAGMLTPKQG